jgi:hypothetical protein
MVTLPDDVIKLMDKVKRECPGIVVGWNYDEWDNFEQYKQHLEQILEQHEQNK